MEYLTIVLICLVAPFTVIGAMVVGAYLVLEAFKPNNIKD